MAHRQVIQDAMFVTQSAVLAAVVVYITISTKPSDVYRRIDQMESRLMNVMTEYTEKVERTQRAVEGVEVWMRGATTTIAEMKNRIQTSEDLIDVIEEKTADRWTRTDQREWESKRFGDVLESSKEGE